MYPKHKTNPLLTRVQCPSSIESRVQVGNFVGLILTTYKPGRSHGKLERQQGDARHLHRPDHWT